MKATTVFFLFLFGAETFIYGQEGNDHEERANPGLEIIVSGSALYTPESGYVDPSTELHITYWVSHVWAYGVGYTSVFEKEGGVGHEVAALISHKPWSILTLNAGPSFGLPNSEHGVEVSAYFEGEINIRIGDKGLHTGPVIGTLLGEEFRLFGGLHMGYEF